MSAAMLRQPKFWSTRGALSIALSPLAALYECGATLHRIMCSPKALPVPVISIGNITAGGAGKTPTTIAIAQLLQQQGMIPHIISRGYGANIAAPLRVDVAQHNVQDVGDEALLLAHHATTWVYPDRHAAGMAAIVAGANVLVCDDALQHHALKKDINLLVIDGAYGIGNGKMLPAGPLRESFAKACARCDAIILIGADMHGVRDHTTLPIFKATIIPSGDVSWLNGTRVTAFAGIARPQKFYQTLLDLGAIPTATYDFPDHRLFSDTELRMLSSHDMPVTTQKDWVRLSPAWQERIRYVPITLQLEDSAALHTWLEHTLRA
jgi:tetraacyldisaccharide 4'-kinase